MCMRKSIAISICLIFASIVISTYLYDQMPAQMVSHWSFTGQPDGLTTKPLALFVMPVISTFLLLLFVVIPGIDPMNKNFKNFRKYYDAFIVILMAFLFYLYALTIIWNLGNKFNMNQAISPAFGVLFWYCGVLIQNSQPNWFVGIRTPWTLSNKHVWKKTHEAGGKLFKTCGSLAFIGLVLPDLAIYFILVPVLVSAAFVVVLSYCAYRHQTASRHPTSHAPAPATPRKIKRAAKPKRRKR